MSHFEHLNARATTDTAPDCPRQQRSKTCPCKRCLVRDYRNFLLRPFITAVNRIKRQYPVFQEECPTSVLPCHNPNILLLWKASMRGQFELLLILNKDIHSHQEFATDHFRRFVQAGAPLHDVSPEYRLEYIPEPFHYALRPGQGIVLVTTRDGGRQ